MKLQNLITKQHIKDVVSNAKQKPCQERLRILRALRIYCVHVNRTHFPGVRIVQ